MPLSSAGFRPGWVPNYCTSFSLSRAQNFGEGDTGRTPAEPYPPDGAAKDSNQQRRGPGEDHPWKKKPFKRQK
jgi:hypothetical protein